MKKQLLFVIHPTHHGDYDVLAMGDLRALIKLSKNVKWYHLFEKPTKYGTHLLVLDTYDKVGDAVKAIREFQKENK